MYITLNDLLTLVIMIITILTYMDNHNTRNNP